MKIMRLLQIIACFLFFSNTLSAQTADDIIKKYIAKIGGREKWTSVKSLVVTGTQSTQGMDLPFTISKKNPNLMKLEASVQGQSFIQCYDGKTAWAMNPFAGSGKPEVMAANVAKEVISGAPIVPELFDYATNGDKVVLSKETIAGIAYNKILLTPKDATVKTFYFDPATSNLSMMHSIMPEGPLKGKVIETVFSDYKDEQGLLMFHVVEMKVDGNSIYTINYKTVKINPPIDNSIFMMPAAK